MFHVYRGILFQKAAQVEKKQTFQSLDLERTEHQWQCQICGTSLILTLVHPIMVVPLQSIFCIL